MKNENKGNQKFGSHGPWILSLLTFILFNVMLQRLYYIFFSGGSNVEAWGYVIGMPIVSALGVYTGCLSVVRNKRIELPIRRHIVQILGLLLVLGNLICFVVVAGVFFSALIRSLARLAH